MINSRLGYYTAKTWLICSHRPWSRYRIIVQLVCKRGICLEWKNLFPCYHHITSHTSAGLCSDKDKDGTIGWIAFAIAAVFITAEKWLSTKNFGTTVVALVSYVLIQLSLHMAPIKCVIDNSRKSRTKYIEFVQTCFCAFFFLLYLIIILHKKL